MKVLFLSTWFPYPPDNGSKLRAHYLLRALADRHKVTVVSFCPDAVEEPSARIENHVSVYAVPEDPFRYTRLPRVVKHLSPIPLAYWPFRAMRRTVSHVTSVADWDAVVALQMPAARYALQVSAQVKIIDIDTALSYWALERLVEQQGPLRRARAWLSWQKEYWYERRWLSRFDAGTLVSPVEMPYLKHMLRGNSAALEVIPNGVDCQHNQPGLARSRTGRLVYNGALTYSANYDAMEWFLADTYPLIRARVPDVSVAITGSTRGVDLSGLTLDESVHLTGYVDDVRLPVAEAAVCVVPIRQGGGTRLKVLEAMALGTPVVATSKGAEGLEVVDGEHLLIGDTPETFAEAVLRVMGDSTLRKRLSRNARSLVERQYDWEMIGAQFVALVEEAAKGQ